MNQNMNAFDNELFDLGEVIFNHDFNQPIDNIVWNKDTDIIIFGDNFNQPIENVKWQLNV